MRSVTFSERVGRSSGWLLGGAGAARGIVFLGLLLSIGPAWGEEPVVRLSLHDAIQLAERENATLRAKRFELEGARANEITAGLRPNPTAAYTRRKVRGDLLPRAHGPARPDD